MLRADQLPSGLPASVIDLLNSAIDARLSVGIIGLLVALNSGISWMGNLRAAIQAMWRPDFDSGQDIAAENLLKYDWKSLTLCLLPGTSSRPGGQ